MPQKGKRESGQRAVPGLGITLEHGERLLVAVRPQPGAMFSALWALPFLLALLGLWAAGSGAPGFSWDWNLFALAWVLALGAFALWRRGRIIITDRRLVQVGYLGGVTQVRWAEVRTVSNKGTLKDRFTGYGPRNNPLFVTTKDGRLVRFRQIPRLRDMLELMKPYLPQGAAG